MKSMRGRLVRVCLPCWWLSSSVGLLRFSTGAFALAPPSKTETSVAVIGGGIAGLSCAQALSSSSKFDVTLYDTGRLRPGGRCSSRLPGDQPKEDDEHHYEILSKYRFDHAAQL